MNIEYRFSESEKKDVREYLKYTFIKKVANENRGRVGGSKSAFYFQLCIFTFFSFALVTTVYFNYISYHFYDIMVFIIASFVILMILFFLKKQILLRLYAVNMVAMRRIYWLEKRVSLSFRLYSHMLKIDRMLINFEPVVRINIQNNIAKLNFSAGFIQEFHCQTISYNGIFREIKFYSFTDSKTHRRHILPIPVRILSGSDGGPFGDGAALSH